MRFLFHLLLLGATASAAQLPFNFERPVAPVPQLSPESSPSAITEDTFTVLSHPEFSDHSVRIKRTDGWCDPDVASYTGYLDSGPRHLFFYFFESRRTPKDDDLVLWTNGGPGCSSSMGLLMELGPCTAQKGGNSTKPNEHSWSATANILFIDQPVGVGFSYSDSGVSVGTTEQAAIDVHAFINLFMVAFPEFVGRKFHLAGESYAGRYLPVFASTIVYENSRLLKKNSTTSAINLQSILIGNGLSDVVSMTTSYYEQACTSRSGLGKPVLDIRACVEMQQVVKRCDHWLEKVCRKSVAQPDCDIALDFCETQLEIPFLNAQINPYDISKPCTTLNEDLCYPETSVIKEYLDQPWVRNKLGVDSGIGPFQSCSGKVASAFARTRDVLAPTFFHLTGLLEHNVKVLIYVGTLDWICNFRGNEALLAALEFSGHDGFVAEPLRAWSVDGKGRAGETKSFGGLTWATVENAGHMVPLDKPLEASWMVQRWLAGEPL